VSKTFSLNTRQLTDKLSGQQGRVQVLQFERLMKLAPMGCTEAEVLDVLQQKALLVQGCWVAASFIRYEQPLSIIRDYILSLFNKNRVVLHEQLEDLPISKEALREIMLSLAVLRSNVGWEFQVSV
jgi:DNA-directed RNA polymerase-3 subunit RPC5